MSGLGILLFIVALLLMIMLHEAGHFFTAKWFGIKVEEFFVGFGPRLWSFRRGETEYGIKAIPAGGYVRIAGMNPFQEPAPEDIPRTFGAKPAWQRAIVLVAGSVTHFLLAILLLASALMFVGEPIFGRPVVGAVDPTLDGRPSPAVAAGLMVGDEIVEVNGEPIDSSEELIRLTGESLGEEMTLVVLRDGRRETVRAAPVLSTVEGEKVARLGIRITSEIVGRDRVNPASALWRGVKLTGDLTVASVKGLGQIFSPSGLGRLWNLLTGQAQRQVDDPAGIVGAGRLAGQAASSGNLDLLLGFLAALNVFVGILNILPLPPLDGGHLAVLGLEKLTGKTIDVRKLIPITAVVAGLLILLTLSLTYLDLVEPIPNPFR
ncbi:MAG TPA: M50 family metallopeptidase [Actinomycetota bacterium]|nr:M50 family metallopeptidase [Actinomycetota bacterium]